MVLIETTLPSVVHARVDLDSQRDALKITIKEVAGGE